MVTENDYKKVMDKQLGGLEGEVNRQTEEYKSEKGSLGSKIMQYAHDKGITDKAVKVWGATTLAYIIGVAAPIVTGPSLAIPVLVLYGGKKFVYDPLFKRKKK